MERVELKIETPADFNFWRTTMSHGWYALPPFYLDRKEKRLERILRVGQSAVSALLEDRGDRAVTVTVESSRHLGNEAIAAIKKQAAHILRLNESMADFYAKLDNTSVNGHLAWIRKAGAGRLLRSPDVFEDVVKMMCTTNCAWRATERMVANLVEKLGTRFSPTRSAFPTARQLASANEAFLVREARTGYRSAYLLEFASKVARGQVDLARWTTLGEEDLYEEILSIKGIGPYAAGNLMRLLGYYTHLGLDSWCRPRFSELYRKGRPVSDKVITSHYRKYGRWSGLVMWLELTRDWFDEDEVNLSTQ